MTKQLLADVSVKTAETARLIKLDAIFPPLMQLLNEVMNIKYEACAAKQHQQPEYFSWNPRVCLITHAEVFFSVFHNG